MLEAGQVVKPLFARMSLLLLLLGLALPGTAYAHDLHYETLPGNVIQSLSDARASRDWQPGAGVASFGYDGQRRWLRYQIPEQSGNHIFSIMNPWLTRFDIYLVSADGDVKSYELGSFRPVSERPLVTTTFDVPLGPRVEEIYIYDYGEGVAYFPVDVHSAADYSGFTVGLSVFQGVYYGIVLIMLLYNFSNYVATRHKGYLFYSLYGVGLTMLLSAMDGTLAVFLIPDSPWLMPWIITTAWACALIFRLFFVKHFLQLHDRIWQYGLMLLAAPVLFSLLFSWVAPGATADSMRALVSVLVLAGFVGSGVWAVRQRRPNSIVFMLANGLLVLSCFVHISTLFQLLEPNLITQHAIHVGSALELVMLAMALARRLRQTQQARFRAYQRTQELHQHNKELQAARNLAEEHRQLQRSLQQAQKLRTIGQLAGGFAHDFNNILASILGFAELSQQPAVLADRAKLMHYLQQIQDSGERGAKLVQQLLVYSQGKTASPRRLDLAEALEQATGLLRSSLPATVQLNTTIHDQGIYLTIDPEQLQQVLVNLSINAAEAMNERGAIRIELGMIQAEEHSCSSCLGRFSGEYAAIRISDTGPGIRGNAQEIFTPFQSSKEAGQGIGLGLSVVHGIVHEHDGHIHASNTAEGGARFVVYLPVNASISPAKRSSKRILLVEDDAALSNYMSALLAEEDYATTVAHLPTEALELFMADPDAFDLVITDYLMPLGTGLELAQDVHALRPDLPVILYTGNATGLTDTEVADASIAAVFKKPLNADALIARIRGLLTS